jgi:protein-disulfide isomerase
VLGTPTLFIDGVVHRGGYDPPTLLAALATSE